jgi:dethiobiotin synthetase
LQGDGADLTKISPFVFPKPLAPGAQEHPGGKRPALADALGFVRQAGLQADVLLVEGCGGLMVPLGPGFMILDLIRALQCRVILVAANRLGAINHVLLSLRALESVGCEGTRVILSSVKRGGGAVGRSNEQYLQGFLGEDRVFALGYMGKNAGMARVFEKSDKTVKKLKKVLVGVMGGG